MKKRILVLVSLLLISVLLLAACSGGSGASHKQGEYETLFDHSEINWYLTQKYGNDAPEHYYFYEINDGEESFLIAKKMDDSELPEYVIHAFNSDIHDWYLYDNLIFEGFGSETVGNTEDGTEIKRTPIYAYDSVSYITSTCDKSGRANKMLFTYGDDEFGYFYSYTYDKKGRVESFYANDLSFYDAFFKEPDMEGYYEIYKYSYDDKDRLVKLSVDQNGNTGDEWLISYEDNGHRKSIKYFYDKKPFSDLEFVRDESGRVLQGISTEYSENSSEPYVRTINISYQPGGMTTYDNGWEPY